MERKTFQILWSKYAVLWLKTKIGNKTVSDLCQFDEDAEERVYKNYLSLKNYVKEKYFISEERSEVVLSRYKRAAVMAYTIIKTNPLTIKDSPIVDDLFLKQRFAFFFALTTILPDYKEMAVKDKKIFESLSKIQQIDDNKGNDSFLISVWKDFFFAELYGNFDILGIANIFGLLFEQYLDFTEKDLIQNG